MANEMKSSEMEEPIVANYDRVYVLTDKFVEDLEVCLGDMAYVTSSQFIKIAKSAKNGICEAKLNEFIRKISHLPYRYIKPVMEVIENAETQKTYFTIKEAQK